MQRLRALQKRFDCIGDVRGKGLMIGAELITDAASRKPAPALCQRVLTRAYHNGLILLSCGVSTLRFIPPLLVSREQVDEAMGLIEISLKEAMVEN
jgi:4-aminobutyrate aminotransferase